LGLLSNELTDVPGHPVKKLVVLSGRRADDLAVDQQEHRRCVVVAWIGMIATADQEIDIWLADYECRRGEGTLSLITSVQKSID
jgi:hypothetical protein